MTIWFYLSIGLLVLLVGSNVWWFYRVLRPLRRLTASTLALASGHGDALQQSCGGIAAIDIVRHSMAGMAGHVHRAQEEGYAFRSALTNGQEAERARIARELHDDTVQSLIVIAQRIDLAAQWVTSDPTRAAATLQTARAQAVESVESLRRMIGNLRPPALEELGLITALRMLDSDNSDIKVQVNGVERRLDEAHELVLFRSAQEAVRNAQKHSGAQRIHVEVSYHPTQVELSVRDDGKGFALPPDPTCFAEAGHYGLLGIYERVQGLGGSVGVSSTPGSGTTVAVTVPVVAIAQPGGTVRDPVCGAVIEPQQAYGSTVYEGQRYYFCCPVCQGAFQRSPALYLNEGTKKPAAG